MSVIVQATREVSAEEHERFFRQMLGDIDEPTLPFGLADVHRDGGEVSQKRRMLPQGLNDRLRAHARRLGVSLASLCHLAFGQVIARASGREAVVFGTVLFGRMTAGEGAEAAMGLFINTLPLRLDLGEQAVEDSVRKAHAQLAELLRHEHASLAMAQRCSGLAAQTPLFSALLNYRHNTPGAASTSSTTTADSITSLGSEERTNYPLTLSVEDFGEGLGLTVQVIEPLSPERVCGYMQQALESLALALEETPATPVRQLMVLPAEERSLLLEDWNRTEAAYPDQLCVHQLFEAQAARTPKATALVFEGEALSYSELNQRANQLAHHLLSLGVGPDQRVGLCVERSVEMVVGLLGVLKAGGAYVPLDPAYPSTRLGQILSDAAPVLLLADAAGRQALGEEALAGVEVIEAAQKVWGKRPRTNPDPARIGLTSSHLAYVIYTSGSTGTPKGVMVEHQNLTNYLSWAAKAFYAAPGAGSPLLQSVSFDASVPTLFGPLLQGQTLTLLATGSEIEDVAWALAGGAPYTVLKLTPSHLRLLNTQLASGQDFVPPLSLMLGGEPLRSEDLALWRERFPKVRLINHFGPTETTVACAAYEVDQAGSDLPSIPIGRPIANARIYLLDGYGEPVPLGAVGEIHIGGAGVARGYLNRPELTAEKFIASPFVAGDRLYKTGDLGRYRSDGDIEFLGRNDHQVKIRGFRIELGEIEARLTEHACVREAVVLAREDAAGDKRLVAYVVGEEASAETLRAHLAACLPEYMVPAAYVRLEVLPLTPNGKLDRKALPDPKDEAFARAAYEAPKGEVEQALAAIWSELLGIDKVSRHDNFFELGGHSLLAVRLISRVQVEVGINLPFSIVFSHSTLKEFCDALLALAISEIEDQLLPENIVEIV